MGESAQYHSLFLSLDGRLWACGQGARGRLGVGSEEDCFYATPVREFYVEGRKARRPRRIGNNGLPLCLGFGQVDPMVTRTPYWPGRRGRLQVPAARLPPDMARKLAMLDEADAAPAPRWLQGDGLRKRRRGRSEGEGKHRGGRSRGAGLGETLDRLIAAQAAEEEAEEAALHQVECRARETLMLVGGVVSCGAGRGAYRSRARGEAA